MRSSLRRKLSLLIVFIFCLLSLPGFAQEDDEQLIEEVQKSRAKQVEMANKINETFDPNSEIKKLGHSEINLKALTDVKVLEVIKKAMNQGALKNASKEEVQKHLLQKLNPTAQGLLLDHPKLLDLIIDILRDEKAMVSLVDILIRKEDLTRYAAIYICLVILGWLLKKILYKKTWSRRKSLALTAAINISIAIISITTFYKLFNRELDPIITVVGRHI